MTAPLGNQLVLIPLNLSVSLDQTLGHIYLFVTKHTFYNGS